MPGSATAALLDRRPLELVVRAALGFGIALWLVARLSPQVLEALLRSYEQFVHLLDDHYRIGFTLTHQTGHDKIGGDLVVLGRAAVVKTFMIFTAEKTITLAPGQVLTSSTATGVLMQPATMILGLLLAWPLASAAEAAWRAALGAVMLVSWQLLGIPLSLWIYFRDIPLRAYAANELSWTTVVGKFLLNGGGVAVGAMLGFAIVLASRAAAGRLRRA